MRLQLQVLLFIIFCAVAGLCATYIIVGGSIVENFYNFEKKQALEDNNRVKNLIQYDIDQLERLAGDWAVWDDTYYFIENVSQDYRESNLTADTFIALDIDYFAILNKQGELIAGQSIHNSEMIDLPPESMQALFTLFKYHNSIPRYTKAISSLMQNGNKVVMFSHHTVSLTDNQGSSGNGYLLFAREIDQAYLDELGKIVKTPISFLQNNSVSDQKHYLTPTTDLAISFIELQDYKNLPIKTLTLEHDREISRYGELVMKKLVSLLLLVTVILALAGHFLMNGLVVKRVARLRRHVQHFTEDTTRNQKIYIKGNSELSDLAEDFNQLVETIHKTQSELKKLSRDAQAANQAKSQFIANISHEIRTPMTAIIGYADVLKADVTDHDRKHIANIIEKNGQHLLNIINDILDISKLEAGKLSFEITKTPLEPLIEEVISLMQLSAQVKGLEFIVKCNDKLPEYLDTDAARMKQILVNLLGNAIKFTNSGRVTFAINCHEQNLKITISDTGIGIPEDMQKQIFKPFYQIENEDNRHFEGTGLGLSIVMDLSKKLNGHIDVESSPNEGTRFTLEFPVNPEYPIITPTINRNKLQENVFKAKEPLNGKVYIVDDNPVISTLLTRILNDFGLVVFSDNSSKSAFQKLMNKEFQVDIILMDMQMPEMDGYTMTQKLIEANIQTPIIAITANNMEGDKEKCLQAGCADFLGKPVSPKTLYETCKRFLKNH